MNYLELCQKTREKAEIPSLGPTSVENQTGVLAQLVGWVSDGWAEIQSNEDWWLFRAKAGQANLIVDTESYVTNSIMPEDFAYFWPNEIFLKKDGVLVTELIQIEWHEYVRTYLHAQLSSQAPRYICIAPTGRVYFDSKPDYAYTVDFNYQQTVQTLAANNDIPILPSDFHDVIWRKALVSYGEHYNAPEVYRPASLYLEQRMDILAKRYLPKVGFRDNVYAPT